MSNDVHVARVSKIQRSADIAKGVVTDAKNIRRCGMVRNMKETQLKNSELDLALVCQQTRNGGAGNAGVGVNEIESPDHTQRDNNESDNNISSCSTLDIGKVENLSLHQLEGQVRELTQRLQHAEQQRVELKCKLEESNAEKELCLRRLEVVSAAHECRITEMHCVIAELSKKLRAKQETTILEEQEPEGSELSFQEEGSLYNSELNLTNPDAECQTDPLEGGAEQSASEGCENVDDSQEVELSREHKMNDTACKGQVEALQEEVLHLKAQIALLQSEIANSLHVDGDVTVEERQNVAYFGEDIEVNESNCAQKTELNVKDFDELSSECVRTVEPFESLSSPQKPAPVAKMAERVRLRCGSKPEQRQENVVTASDLLNVELRNADIVEHLVADLKQHKRSMMDSFTEPSQLDNELQRLQRKIEHLKVRNTVLSLTLDECKEHCDHLYLLCGKYESNAIALQSAVNCSDRAIEAYDVMLALLESRLALMTDKSVSAEESRKAVESVARHLLDRLESEKDSCENSLGPWQATFNIPDKICVPWTSDDDSRLRYHVSKLKGRRSTVQNTIVNLESPFHDLHEKSRLAVENGTEQAKQEQCAQMDLEMAVLMQELLNLREENIALKSKLDAVETERRHATDRIAMLEEAVKQLQLQLQLSTDANILFHKADAVETRISYSEAEHVALTEQQLVEALTRESELKGRIQTLIASVAASQRAADDRHVQLQNNVKELQKSNLNLAQLLEQSKRRYQTRVRKLEQKIMELSVLLEEAQCAVQLQTNITTGSNEQSLRLQSKQKQPETVPETTL